MFSRLLIGLLAVSILTCGGLAAIACFRERDVRELPEDTQYDAIVVLGARVKPEGVPSVQLSGRLDAAAKVFFMHNVPIVVCGGQGADEPCTESSAMKRYLTEKGIDGSWIHEDPESFNTYENLGNAKKILENLPDIRCILIVTSDYHVARSMAIGEDLGYEVKGLGAPCTKIYWLKNHSREALAWIKYWTKKILKLPI